MNDKDILREMGERIYNCRKSLKMTQEELAERIGVSTQMISNLELGKKAIRPENLIKLCFALSVSADYILIGGSFEDKNTTLCHKLNRLSQKELDIIEKMMDYMNERE